MCPKGLSASLTSTWIRTYSSRSHTSIRMGQSSLTGVPAVTLPVSLPAWLSGKRRGFHTSCGSQGVKVTRFAVVKPVTASWLVTQSC